MIPRAELGAAIGKQLAGLPVHVSTQVAKNRTKAAGTNLSYIIAGNFAQALIGRYGAVELAVSTDVAFGADQTAIRAILRVDFALAHGESFCVSDQLIVP